MYYGLAKEQADPREWQAPLVQEIERQRRVATAANALPQRRAWRDRVLAAVVAAKRRVLAQQESV
jgi:hypothetical protein